MAETIYVNVDTFWIE